MQKGMMIVLYGVNNLGKTTQARLLVKTILSKGRIAQYLKYPIYNLAPTGHLLEKILRSGGKQEISEEDFQKIYVQNRRDFEPHLKTLLNAKVVVVAEDYTGTGIAWGMAKGAKLENLEAMNQDLIKEDMAILLDGERFLEGKENNHLHEKDNILCFRCREIHKFLARRYGWHKINANQSIETVHRRILKTVKPFLEKEG